MKIYGKNRKGKPECSTQPRKRTTPTKAEKKLKRRQASYVVRKGYRCPGSLQAS